MKEPIIETYVPQNNNKMENQEKKETSLEYFHKRTRNNVNNLDYQKESLEHAIKLYEEEIEKAYNKGWLEGAKNSLSYATMLSEFNFTNPKEMSKQTAVEWFIEKLIVNELIDVKNGYEFLHLQSKAMEMEKDHIINSFKHGEYPPPLFINYNAEEYYNETFKK